MPTLAELLERLEVPDCACDPEEVSVPRCLFLGLPCAAQLATRACDCTHVLRTCRHVVEFRWRLADDEWEEVILDLYVRTFPGRRPPAWIVEQWAELLRAAWPRRYCDPPLPDEPAGAEACILSQAARVDLMDLRAGPSGRDHALHYPGERWLDEDLGRPQRPTDNCRYHTDAGLRKG
jgi:hypothetical protein